MKLIKVSKYFSFSFKYPNNGREWIDENFEIIKCSACNPWLKFDPKNFSIVSYPLHYILLNFQ